MLYCKRYSMLYCKCREPPVDLMFYCKRYSICTVNDIVCNVTVYLARPINALFVIVSL